MIWLPEDEKEYKDYIKNLEVNLLYGKTIVLEYKDYLKLAWVIINNEKEMIYVHNQDLKGYKFQGYYELIQPLEEVKYDSFDRWCTGFDV
jgi:hypothetical protein